MSTLSYMLTDNLDDPRKEGYPCYGISGGANNNTVATNFLINSELSPIGTGWTAITSTTSSAGRTGMLLDPNWNYSASDMLDSGTAQLTTNDPTAYQFYQSLHQNDQYPAGMWAEFSARGWRNSVQFLHAPTSGKFQTGRNLINQVLPEGVRPRRYFSVINNVFAEHSSMNMLHVRDRDTYDFSALRPTGFTARTTCLGAAGYNERTKTLVLTFNDSTNTLTVIQFTGQVDLNRCLTLEQFFTGATVKAYDVTYTYNASNNGDRTVVVGDNGVVVIGYRTSNNLQGHVWDSTIATPVSTALNTVAGTTSYGVNTNNSLYTKMQLSWDGKWAFIYQPYSHYGNGACGYVVSTEDPSRYFTYIDTNTSFGGAIMPRGKSGFVHFIGNNTDGSGIVFQPIDLELTSRTGVADTVISTAGGAAVIANGGAINPAKTNLAQHGGQYTTNYPRFHTVNWWPINGKFSYEGVLGNE